jgi:hypothetical protein
MKLRKHAEQMDETIVLADDEGKATYIRVVSNSYPIPIWYKFSDIGWSAEVNAIALEEAYQEMEHE